MSSLPLLILVSTGIFIAGLLLQNFSRLKFCAVCVGISGSWLILLVAKQVGYHVSPALIGVLMGESVVGIYYLLERTVNKSYAIFRWPFLISATVIVLIVVGERSNSMFSMVLLTLIWIIFGMIYFYRENGHYKKVVERLIACCRDW